MPICQELSEVVGVPVAGSAVENRGYGVVDHPVAHDPAGEGAGERSARQWSREIASNGVYPQRQRILVAKGTTAPRAAYEPIAAAGVRLIVQ